MFFVVGCSWLPFIVKCDALMIDMLMIVDKAVFNLGSITLPDIEDLT